MFFQIRFMDLPRWFNRLKANERGGGFIKLPGTRCIQTCKCHSTKKWCFLSLLSGVLPWCDIHSYPATCTTRTGLAIQSLEQNDKLVHCNIHTRTDERTYTCVCTQIFFFLICITECVQTCSYMQGRIRTFCGP